jgi:hypothetical protein|tara:strand:- start:4254 stop:4472 length:219 start_codon:yes stop_codon:yes gene_type:complete
MIVTEIDKLCKAIHILKPNAQFTIRGNVVNEETFNNIEWITGADAIGSAVFTKTCPHSEITYAKILEEMDKL